MPMWQTKSQEHIQRLYVFHNGISSLSSYALFVQSALRWEVMLAHVHISPQKTKNHQFPEQYNNNTKNI
jgi:hypothetical protein